jgi:hypothetical protein
MVPMFRQSQTPSPPTSTSSTIWFPSLSMPSHTSSVPFPPPLPLAPLVPAPVPPVLMGMVPPEPPLPVAAEPPFAAFAPPPSPPPTSPESELQAERPLSAAAIAVTQKPTCVRRDIRAL